MPLRQYRVPPSIEHWYPPAAWAAMRAYCGGTQWQRPALYGYLAVLPVPVTRVDWMADALGVAQNTAIMWLSRLERAKVFGQRCMVVLPDVAEKLRIFSWGPTGREIVDLMASLPTPAKCPHLPQYRRLLADPNVVAALRVAADETGVSGFHAAIDAFGALMGGAPVPRQPQGLVPKRYRGGVRFVPGRPTPNVQDGTGGSDMDDQVEDMEETGLPEREQSDDEMAPSCHGGFPVGDGDAPGPSSTGCPPGPSPGDGVARALSEDRELRWWVLRYGLGEHVVRAYCREFRAEAALVLQSLRYARWDILRGRVAPEKALRAVHDAFTEHGCYPPPPDYHAAADLRGVVLADAQRRRGQSDS